MVTTVLEWASWERIVEEFQAPEYNNWVRYWYCRDLVRGRDPYGTVWDASTGWRLHTPTRIRAMMPSLPNGGALVLVEVTQR